MFAVLCLVFVACDNLFSITIVSIFDHNMCLFASVISGGEYSFAVLFVMFYFQTFWSLNALSFPHLGNKPAQSFAVSTPGHDLLK